LKINGLIWLEDIVDKLHWKHDIEEQEVVEVLENKPKFVLKEAKILGTKERLLYRQEI
jgi:hypothetical protein